MKTIAVIDDDVYIGNMLEEILQREGYGVIRAYSGTEALYLLERRTPDLVLLDLMLPGLSGEMLLPHIRHIPVIVVSAKIEIENKVSVLLNGAADYMTKPFDIKELLARITVQLRRSNDHPSHIITLGDLCLDTGSHDFKVSDISVKLTKTEYAILKCLMLNNGQAVSKSIILETISFDTPDCTDSSLKQHISNLRKKLRTVGGKDYIESIWGIGFKING